jgi:hypothetical protein
MGSSRSNEPPLPVALAYFLTWPTYGTWLPGDERGWVEYRHGWQLPDSIRKLEAEARMTEDACTLDTEERTLVEATIAEHCRIRGWELHAVNCRTNHLHVVVTADPGPGPGSRPVQSVVYAPAQGIAGETARVHGCGGRGQASARELVGGTRQPTLHQR